MRALRPSGYAGTIVAHGGAPAAGLLMLGGWSGGAAGVLALWALVRTGSVLLNARRTGCGARDVLLLPVADLLALALYVGGHCGRSVRWGESRFRVGRAGAIVVSDPLGEAAPQTEYGT